MCKNLWLSMELLYSFFLVILQIDANPESNQIAQRCGGWGGSVVRVGPDKWVGSVRTTGPHSIVQIPNGRHL